MKQIKFSATPELRKWLKEEAARTGDSEASIIRQALHARRYAQANGILTGKADANV